MKHLDRMIQSDRQTPSPRQNEERVGERSSIDQLNKSSTCGPHIFCVTPVLFWHLTPASSFGEERELSPVIKSRPLFPALANGSALPGFGKNENRH